MKNYILLLLLLGTLLITNCSDDDGGSGTITYTASINSTSTSIAENGGSASITVTLDQANQGDAIPFQLSLSGSATVDVDYSISGSTTIDNGSTSVSFTVTATDDSDVEGDEEVTIGLSFANGTNVTVGNNGSLTLTITDDDSQTPPTFTASISSATSSIQENGGSASFTVELDRTNQGSALPFNLAFTGTATLDTDYTVSSEPRTIASGSSSATFTVTGTDDSDVEGDESITVTLSFTSNNVTVSNNGSLAFTITDDDSNTTCAETDTYSINMDASGCTDDIQTKLGVSSVYTVTVANNERTIVSNGIPDHNVGVFPGNGNPNTISVQSKTFVVDANPSKNNNTTALTTGNGLPRYWFGILDNSVVLAPIANEFFMNTSTGENNTDWNENALSSNINLGTDCNNSHVFPTGRYHHHATPSAYIAARGIGSSTPTQVGWAADGFPIYYKYGNKNGSVVELASSFQLKTTDRGGDGVSAPSGCPDGTYNEDYEYVPGLGDLDECNGYQDPTLGYIYIITDTYPSIPRCFYGTPSSDFENN